MTDEHGDSKCFELLSLLRDGEGHRLTDLGSNLGMNKADLLRAVRATQTLGADLDVDPEELRWRSPFALYDAPELRSSVSIEAGSLLGELRVLRSIDSTNRYVFGLDDVSRMHGLCCVAEMQRAGRGRRGKSFLSPLGNIYLSVCWLTKRSPAELGALSLAMGVAVAETLETVGVEVALKWPNDILFRDKKMAGILVETEKRDEVWMVVVGVGINVLLTPSHQESDRWTNVSQATRRAVDRNGLAGELISRILVGLDLFDRKGFSAFRARWNARHAMAGKRVRLTSEDHSTEGIALDVDETGAFRLQIDGTTRSFVTGALSLRLI